MNTSTSPKVQYAYSAMPSGANHSRLTSITYPDGYVLTYNYASGLDSGISRLTSLSDSTGTLEAYSYLGLGTVVVRAHPQPNVDLSYAKRSGEGVGDAGDQYIGLDRFGRVVDQRWLNPTTGTATDRFQYGYDAAGNRTFRDNLVSAAFGEVYTYDALDQLASFSRGTLNGTRTGITGAVARSQGWATDAVGNFTGVTTNGTTQARTANAQNEITAVGGATTPTYDANGNLTGDETGRQFGYDAWNRLVVVKNAGGTTLKTYAYDGLNRRASETAGGTTTDLYYSAAWQVLTEKVGTATTKRYVWSPVYVDALVLRDRDSTGGGTLNERLWVQQDANWNVTALVDGSGAVVERYAYDPYGVRTVYDASYTVRGGGSSYGFQHGFQGMRFDATAGLNFTHTRPYSPTLGRFTGPDWIRFDGGDVNLYRFVGNDPTNSTDPSGFERELGNRPDRPVLHGLLSDPAIQRPFRKRAAYIRQVISIHDFRAFMKSNYNIQMDILGKSSQEFAKLTQAILDEKKSPCPNSEKIGAMIASQLALAKSMKEILSGLRDIEEKYKSMIKQAVVYLNGADFLGQLDTGVQLPPDAVDLILYGVSAFPIPSLPGLLKPNND